MNEAKIKSFPSKEKQMKKERRLQVLLYQLLLLVMLLLLLQNVQVRVQLVESRPIIVLLKYIPQIN